MNKISQEELDVLVKNMSYTIKEPSELDQHNIFLDEYDLSGLDLSKFNLRSASFGETKLSKTDPFRAIYNKDTKWPNGFDPSLVGALCKKSQEEIDNLLSIRNKNLSGLDLSNVVLRGCDLRGTDLRGTRLNEADLSEANLSRANLNGADLQGAVLNKATFSKYTKWPKGFDPIAAGAILIK